jgi:threonine aldolase
VSGRLESFEVDIASDTKTPPSAAKRQFTCRAPVGDEQAREHPTVAELEQRVAHLAGKQAALLLPSGTMCNIIAFFLDCRPDDEVFVHRSSHVVYEVPTALDAVRRARAMTGSPS